MNENLLDHLNRLYQFDRHTSRQINALAYLHQQPVQHIIGRIVMDALSNRPLDWCSEEDLNRRILH